MRLPVTIFTSDFYFLELHEIYQMIFEEQYGRIVGMNHSGTREEFLGEGVR